MSKAEKKYKTMDDEALLGAFRHGSNGVLEELYHRYAHLCFGLSLKYLKDRDKAKDAVSDIFIKLRVGLAKHEIKVFRSWFYTYSKNHCLGLLRKAAVVKKHEERWETDRDRNEYEGEEIDFQLSQMQEALNRLKPQQMHCVKAFYFEKQSYTDISQNLQMSVKQVKSNLQNGKRNLRLLLEAKQSSNHHD